MFINICSHALIWILMSLHSFIDVSCAKLHCWAAKGTAAAKWLTISSFEIIGVLHCIAQIFKKGIVRVYYVMPARF